jgi:hypothetical protein
VKEKLPSINEKKKRKKRVYLGLHGPTSIANFILCTLFSISAIFHTTKKHFFPPLITR